MAWLFLASLEFRKSKSHLLLQPWWGVDSGPLSSRHGGEMVSSWSSLQTGGQEWWVLVLYIRFTSESFRNTDCCHLLNPPPPPPLLPKMPSGAGHEHVHWLRLILSAARMRFITVGPATSVPAPAPVTYCVCVSLLLP